MNIDFNFLTVISTVASIATAGLVVIATLQWNTSNKQTVIQDKQLEILNNQINNDEENKKREWRINLYKYRMNVYTTILDSIEFVNKPMTYFINLNNNNNIAILWEEKSSNLFKAFAESKFLFDEEIASQMFDIYNNYKKLKNDYYDFINQYVNTAEMQQIRENAKTIDQASYESTQYILKNQKAKEIANNLESLNKNLIEQLTSLEKKLGKYIDVNDFGLLQIKD